MCVLTTKKKIVIALAIISIVMVSFIGGQSFSKYIAEIKANGTAEVATWSFKVNGETEQVQSIQLGSTCHNETLVDNKIAPGTSGSFNIVIDATGSDVGIDYKVKFVNEKNKPANVRYIYDNVEYTNIADLESTLQETIQANEDNKVRTLTIGWKWDYEKGNSPAEIAANDAADTKDGKTIKNYSFDVIMIGTQVMPQT